MDFVVARGLKLPFPALFDRSGFALDAEPTLVLERPRSTWRPSPIWPDAAAPTSGCNRW